MRPRHLALLAALTVVITVVWLAPVHVAGQASTPASAKLSSKAPAKAWSPPHTQDGQPDLQGTWANDNATPLERPKEFAGREFLTDEELAALKQRAGRLF